MIISRKHKYLFIEVPLTASWAIHHELCELYDGTPILHKHATFPEFRRLSDVRPDEYFVFGAVRNPIETVVSQYYKLKNDHRGAFSDPGSANRLQVDYADYGKYEFVSNGASFEEYFLRFYHRPFGDLADVASGRFDFMIRFERLQSDFSIVLDRLDIKQTRPIPVMNRTKGKRGTAESHYTPELVGRARQVFGPYMRKWGYDFPAGWGRNNPSWFRTLEYQFLTFVRALYLTRFRYDRGPLSRAVRRLRTLL